MEYKWAFAAGTVAMAGVFALFGGLMTLNAPMAVAGMGLLAVGAVVRGE